MLKTGKGLILALLVMMVACEARADEDEFKWFPADPLSSYWGVQAEYTRVKTHQGSGQLDQIGLLAGVTLGNS